MLRLFIGANNETGKVDKTTLKKFLDQLFSGYTIIDARGRWKGHDEDSVIVEIQPDAEESDKVFIERLVSELKTALEQQSIGYQMLPAINFI